MAATIISTGNPSTPTRSNTLPSAETDYGVRGGEWRGRVSLARLNFAPHQTPRSSKESHIWSSAS